MAEPDTVASQAAQRLLDCRDTPYKALDHLQDEIRLVRISASGSNHQICCSAESYSLEYAPSYVALSYTWGMPDPDTSILLNHQVVPVRKNLLRFLQEVRRSRIYADRLFWIDAICINQCDSLERTHQVGLMEQIYRKASQVLVWLGPAYGNSGAALRAVRRCASCEDCSANDFSKIWRKPEGLALRGLCERQYWTRLWVLQEIVLSRDTVLMCGSDCAPWTHFTMVLQRASLFPPCSRRDLSPEYSATMDSRATSLITQIAQARESMSLYRQMQASESLRCHEPRDKVYALLGVVNTGADGLAPDYAVRLPTLFNAVLRNEHKLRPPQTLLEVRKQCRWLCRTAGMDSEAMFALEDQAAVSCPSISEMALSPLIDEESQVVLWWAALYQHVTVQELWLAKRGRTDLESYFGAALTQGRLATVRFMLSTGLVDLTFRDARSRGPLLLAALSGQQHVARYLLEYPGINLNSRTAQSDGYRTVLHIATAHLLTDLLQDILRRPDLDIDSTDGKGFTAIDLGIQLRRPTSVLLLLGEMQNRQVRLHANAIWSTGDTLLSFAIRSGEEGLDLLDFLLLLDRLDINATDRYGEPAIFHALTARNLQATGLLLDRQDIDIGAISSGGSTLLDAALWTFDCDIVAQVIVLYEKAGRSWTKSWPDRFPSAGTTPLLYIVQHGRRHHVKRLLSCMDTTTDINAISQEGHTALSLAITSRGSSIVDLLLSHPRLDISSNSRAPNDPLGMAILAGRPSIVKRLLATGKIYANAPVTQDPFVSWLPTDMEKMAPAQLAKQQAIIADVLPTWHTHSKWWPKKGHAWDLEEYRRRQRKIRRLLLDHGATESIGRKINSVMKDVTPWEKERSRSLDVADPGLPPNTLAIPTRPCMPLMPVNHPPNKGPMGSYVDRIISTESKSTIHSAGF